MVLEKELASQLAVVGGVEEGVQLGVVERDAVAGRAVLLAALEPLDVRIRQATQLAARDGDVVLVVVDVAAELDAEPDQALVQLLHGVAFLGRQVEAVAPVVAQGELEQPSRIVRECLSLGAGRVGLERAVDLLAKAEAAGEHVEALFLLVGHAAQGGLGGNLREESELTAGLSDQVGDAVEREHGVLEVALAIGH